MARRSTNSATSRRPAAERTRPRAAFTILELLVVIGIVLAVAAVAVPFTLRQLDRRQEAETIDRLGLLLRFARAESRASGMPVIVRVASDGRVVEARRLDPRAADLPPLDAEGVTSTDIEADETGEVIIGAWSRLEFPGDLRVAPEPSVGDAGWVDPLDSIDLEPSEDKDDAPWSEATGLVLLLPDGTAIATQPFGIATARGWRPCSIEPYGGRLAVAEPVDADLESDLEPDLEPGESTVMDDDPDDASDADAVAAEGSDR